MGISEHSPFATALPFLLPHHLAATERAGSDLGDNEALSPRGECVYQGHCSFSLPRPRLSERIKPIMDQSRNATSTPDSLCRANGSKEVQQSTTLQLNSVGGGICGTCHGTVLANVVHSSKRLATCRTDPKTAIRPPPSPTDYRFLVPALPLAPIPTRL